MKSNNKHRWQTIKAISGRLLRPVKSVAAPLLVAAVFFGLSLAVFAQLNPGSGPEDAGSQSYTLGQICERLESGAEGQKATSFTEHDGGVDDTMCTLNELMALAPEVDDTDGATTDDVADGKTFWGLRSDGWGLLTGTGLAITGEGFLAATGQTTSYGDRDDGELQMGATADPRFTDNEDGTVTDNLTGLIWLQNANCFGLRTWSNALSDANGLSSGSCGLSDGSVAGDWRLPNLLELESLVDLSRASGPIISTGHPFSNVVSSDYWSSSTYAPGTGSAWRVNFNSGLVVTGHKTNNDFYVWPVRGGGED